MQRRLVSMLGLSEDDDEVMNRERTRFRGLQKKVETVGQGLREHIKFLRDYYGNAEKLAEVTASFWGGEFDRSSDWGAKENESPRSKVALAATTAHERWAYLNKVGRRSAMAILVKYGLDPLRGLHFEDMGSAKYKLDSYDKARAALRKKPSAELSQRKATAREAALTAMATCFTKFDVVQQDIARALVAAHAELLSATAEYLDEAAELNPDAAKFRIQMRDLIQIGGPPLVRKNWSTAKMATEFLTGRAMPSEFKRQRNNDLHQRNLQSQQFQSAVESSFRSQWGRVPRMTTPTLPPHVPAAPSPAPRTSMRSTSTTSSTTTASETTTTTTMTHQSAVALYDCSADEDGDLSFQEGDPIEILEQPSHGWWKGKLQDGTIGLFPSNYVELQ